MILLDSMLKSIEVVLGGAVATNQLPWTAHYVDLDGVFALSAAAENDGTTNDSTAVAMIAAPASGHQRQVKFLTVYNADTAAAAITVQINNNGTKRILTKVTLDAGETLEYTSE